MTQRKFGSLGRLWPLLRAVVFGYLACLWSGVAAGSWGVGPLTMDLDLQTRSGVFNVWNSGEEEVFLQIRGRRWEQDASGKDVYTDTRDLVLFPLQLRLGPKEQRVVRVGYRNPENVQTGGQSLGRPGLMVRGYRGRCNGESLFSTNGPA